MVTSNRKFLTWREMAEELGVHEQTIGRYMDRGELQYLWLGGQRKVTRELFEHFLKSHQTTGPLEDPDEDDDS